MGGAASSKYKIHPGREDTSGKRNKALLDRNNASASVVTLIQKDARTRCVILPTFWAHFAQFTPL